MHGVGGGRGETQDRARVHVVVVNVVGRVRRERGRFRGGEDWRKSGGGRSPWRRLCRECRGGRFHEWGTHLRAGRASGAGEGVSKVRYRGSGRGGTVGGIRGGVGHQSAMVVTCGPLPAAPGPSRVTARIYTPSGGWGLPTIDPDSLEAIALLRFADIPFCVYPGALPSPRSHGRPGPAGRERAPDPVHDRRIERVRHVHHGPLRARVVARALPQRQGLRRHLPHAALQGDGVPAQPRAALSPAAAAVRAAGRGHRARRAVDAARRPQPLLFPGRAVRAGRDRVWLPRATAVHPAAARRWPQTLSRLSAACSSSTSGATASASWASWTATACSRRGENMSRTRRGTPRLTSRARATRPSGRRKAKPRTNGQDGTSTLCGGRSGCPRRTSCSATKSSLTANKMKPTRRPLLARGSADNAHVRHAAAPAARLRLDLLHTRRTTRNVMNLIIDLIHQLRRPLRPALEHGDHIGDPPRRQHISPDGADNLDAALPLIHPSPDQAGVHDVQHDVLDLNVSPQVRM
ncbi:unnamed protein product [Chondrus crispus]|uniref:Uncharacterized protein n=1 Tax=Chondrus crispus TaxID=2769 RepID=R7QMF9_CHOCR|nr:unnamed protein product [Chondrus crispus]CDF38948.1 unnamed protein product [Chondrus crispus]|eukprot:XP_005718853.1 unnamed protein product [Chondrus crispus]